MFSVLSCFSVASFSVFSVFGGLSVASLSVISVFCCFSAASFSVISAFGGFRQFRLHAQDSPPPGYPGLLPGHPGIHPKTSQDPQGPRYPLTRRLRSAQISEVSFLFDSDKGSKWALGGGIKSGDLSLGLYTWILIQNATVFW